MVQNAFLTQAKHKNVITHKIIIFIFVFHFYKIQMFTQYFCHLFNSCKINLKSIGYHFNSSKVNSIDKYNN